MSAKESPPGVPTTAAIAAALAGRKIEAVVIGASAGGAVLIGAGQ